MYKECASLGNPVVQEKEPVAVEICRFAGQLAGRAAGLATWIDGKLSPITTPAPPACVTDNKLEGRVYPPLFAELQDRFIALSAAMDQIEDTLSRTEL
jgi:hypothetical protein